MEAALRRYLPAAILAVLVVLALVLSSHPSGPGCGGPTVTFVIDFDGGNPRIPEVREVGCVKLRINGTTWTFTGVPVGNGTTVYDALVNLSSWFGFELKVKWYSLGPFIDGIAGVNSDPVRGMYWIYYVNGQYAQVGAGSYVLGGGELVLWRYEKVM